MHNIHGIIFENQTPWDMREFRIWKGWMDGYGRNKGFLVCKKKSG